MIKKRILFNPWFLSCCIGILLLWVGSFGLKGWRAYFYKVHHRVFFQHDPLLGWKHRPGSKQVFFTDEYITWLSFNSKGLRGPERSYSKEDGKFRILVLGDSFVEGYGVNNKEHFSEVLKRGLGTKGKMVDVINAGVAGYSTDQELLFYKEEGKKYEPDLTVLMFSPNDVWYNSQSIYSRGHKPYYVLHQGELVVKNIPVPLPNKVREERGFFHNVKLLFKDKEAYALARGRLPDERRIFMARRDEAVEAAWRLTERLIVEMKKEVKGRLLIVYVPEWVNIYAKERARMLKQYAVLPADWYDDLPASRLRMICRRARIDFFDPTAMFRVVAEKPGARLIYYAKDHHWNAEGHSLIGKALAGLVYSRYLSGQMPSGVLITR